MGCNDKHMGSAVLLPQQRSAESQQGHGEKFKAIGVGGRRQRSAVPDGPQARVSQSCPRRGTSWCRGTCCREAQQYPAHGRWLKMLPGRCRCCGQPSPLRYFAAVAVTTLQLGWSWGAALAGGPSAGPPLHGGHGAPRGRVRPTGSARAAAGLRSSTVATGHLGHRRLRSYYKGIKTIFCFI